MASDSDVIDEVTFLSVPIALSSASPQIINNLVFQQVTALLSCKAQFIFSQAKEVLGISLQAPQLMLIQALPEKPQ